MTWTVMKTVRKIDRNGKTRPAYRCRCSCGNVRVVRAALIDQGKSLGCKSCANRRRTGTANSKWRGCGDLSGFVFASIRTNARRRGIAFKITVEYAWKLYVAQQGLCAYTGYAIDFKVPVGKKQALGTASLDRIDSGRPYEEGNVQWVHKEVNMMKRSMPEGRFLELCQAITDNRRPR